ncbi:tetratricopeptide repeat-containing sensor histidine kinase [Hymenobacter canadensis]|uniref:histidine kinase n=1 Tax=Hymenobacter canadensis TaxID=2999067 RepID=A0ABY7LQU7_9BACT|nr:tetratricopeptide repeat protein [Hymenobacter canadensis]WBA42799.1 tetratricopeptide repeat protein [Hymenobacter canadensis]
MTICRWLPFWGILLLLAGAPARAQSPQSAPLRRALAQATSDTARVLLLADLSATYRYSRFDSVRYFARQGLRLARRIGFRRGEGRCLSRLGILMGERGNLPAALRVNLQALQLNEDSHDLAGTARTLNQTGLLYFALDDFRPALRYFLRALQLYEQSGSTDDSQLISVLTNLGASYEGLHKLDSTAYFLNRAHALTIAPHPRGWSCWGNPLPYVLREMGLLHASRGQTAQAIVYYHRSAAAAVPENDQRSRSRAYQYMAELYRSRQQPDSSIFYARQALAVGQTLPFTLGILRNSALLANAFEAQRRPDSTLKYLRIMLTAQDSLYDPQRIKQLDAIGFAEQQRLRQLEDESAQLNSSIRLYLLWAGLGILSLTALLLGAFVWRQRRANHVLQQLNQQVTEHKTQLTQQRDRLAHMLQDLRAAQSQLVLREKMATLGELMTGVAQEIQNPMSTVKNLAAISVDLCQEIREELAKLPLAFDEQQDIEGMFENLSRYQTRIVKQSQRADDIVAGMLDYSSSSPAQRQPTDLNVLANEYMRLVYHDQRLKNRLFNAALLPRLWPELPMVPLVRQDVGRVLVSLFTNAFYAVQQRQRLGLDDDYVPQVTLVTELIGDYVEVRVRDNGLGISAAAQANVFQRFFTTKPSGEGTGLGLAVSFDIITRGHGGSLRVESVEGEYTEFIMQLPVEAKPLPIAWTTPA